MAQKESVLTDEEKESIVIEKFIFHIIDQDKLNPIFLDEVELLEGQKDFFTKRLKDISEGIQHNFKDKETSSFFKACYAIIEDPSKNFIKISQELTASFKSYHNKNTNNGVFITALVSISGDRQLLYFVKLDHRKVYQYNVHDRKALLKEVERTFVEDKKAIQKAALVDIGGNYVWHVLAIDRTTKGQLALTSYFSDFLTVVQRDTPSSLTTKALRSATKWAITNKNEFSPHEDVSRVKERAINYLETTDVFKINAFVRAVVRDDDSQRQEKLRRSFKRFCDEIGLSGQSFKPNPGSLKAQTKKHVRKTSEGVKIEWEGDPDACLIDLPQGKTSDGMYHIHIRSTSEIEVLDK